MAVRGSKLSLGAHLQSTKPPWTVLLVLEGSRRAESAVKVPDGFLVKVLRGRKCRNGTGLFAELAEVLEFPDYFGHDWDALEECLADLEWLPAKGYVLVFTEAELIAADDEDEFATFVEVLNDAAEAWAVGETGKRAKPFHAVLAVSERNKSKRMHWGVPEAAVLPTRSPRNG